MLACLRKCLFCFNAIVTEVVSIIDEARDLYIFCPTVGLECLPLMGTPNSKDPIPPIGQNLCSTNQLIPKRAIRFLQFLSDFVSIWWPQEEAEGVYSFPMFTADLCAKFVEEVENYQDSGLPVRRPNSMNNYGLIVNEIGMEGMIDNLQVRVGSQERH